MTSNPNKDKMSVNVAPPKPDTGEDKDRLEMEEHLVVGNSKLPNAEYFVSEKNKFVPNKFAKWVIRSPHNHYVSLRDTDEVLRYDQGIYVAHGDKDIEEMVVNVMDGYDVTPAKCAETVFLVKRRVAHDRTEVDAEGDIINLANGLYNIRTSEISPHTPEYLSVRRMGVTYDPDAVCPRIDKFINEVVGKADTEFVYELFGYMLLTEKRFRTAVFLEGAGKNGKSVLMKIMKHFIGNGSWSDVEPNDMGSEDKYARADLYGKLLNVVDDLGDDLLKGLGPFKSVISCDSVRAQRKYGHAFSFTPTVLCVFGCNAIPETTDKSDGFFSRMRCLNFPNQFVGSDDNRNLIDELTTESEMSGLFNKAVEAIKNVIEQGYFTGDTSIEERRNTYLNKSNNIHGFVNEYCDFSDPKVETPKDEIYEIYRKWCIRENHTVKSVGNMTTMFKERGVKPTRPTIGMDRVNCYKGVKISPRLSNNGSCQGLGQGHVRVANQEQEDSCQGCQGDSDIVSTKKNEGGSKIKSLMGEKCGSTLTSSRCITNPDPDSDPDKTLTENIQQSKHVDISDESIDIITHAFKKLTSRNPSIDGWSILEITGSCNGRLSSDAVGSILAQHTDALGAVRTNAGYKLAE